MNQHLSPKVRAMDNASGKRLNARACRRGMTLVELLLAMSITSIVALTAGGMLTAVSYGSAERTDIRSLVVRQELISHRLAAAIRASKQVLEYDNEQIVLWVTDANNDLTPQINEVRWIELEGEANTLSRYQVVFPELWTQEQVDTVNKDYATGSSRAVQTNLVSAHVTGELWADHVSDWLITPGNSTVTQSTLVSYRVTITLPGKQSQTVVGAAALRSQ